MDSKTAKRAATKLEASLEFDRDDKIWNLVTANNEVACFESSELKALSKDEMEAQIAQMMAATETKKRGRKAKYPVQVRPSRVPVHSTPLNVIMPDGSEAAIAYQNSNYFFVQDESNLKSIRKDWEGVPERYDAESNTLDLS
ncbi:MAG: hypothetical protein CL840_16300 [Crocinitomicaceae bacterium]|nr:hypothetical protein [Crocinitomicaceae bacterium]|tara:strand:- start:3655 stop:4080 length:426 start_codon:yes stop_codon:yes gene_type:complete